MLLLIPGPVTTRPEVKAAMCYDLAPWDRDFASITVDVLERLRDLAGGRPDQHVTLAIGGSGHFIIEAAIRTFVPEGGKLLVPVTGQYGERMMRLAREAGRVVLSLPVGETERVAPEAVAAALAADRSIGHVGLVYSETGTGIVHDVEAIGAVARAAGRRVILDAVSAFGAMPLDLVAQPEIDAALFTANKCLEGMPGLAMAVARIDRLRACEGNAQSWSLDLADMWHNGQVNGCGYARFTPPAQVISALRAALGLYDAEGGRQARLARYQANMRTLRDGIRALGLHPCVPDAIQGPIVFNVLAPHDPRWDLHHFVEALKRRGFLISNFYNTRLPSFRVGCIGAVTPDDMRRAVAAMAEALDEMHIRTRETV